MFGSKLRSWMENHIVRPRKKGNKNKNAGGNLASTSAQTASTSNGHKGTAASAQHHPGGVGVGSAAETFATISSPARRSEVSPIQCHTTSRAGWHSPQQETATSPQSDHYLYRHTVRSPTSSAKASCLAKSMPRKSSYTTHPSEYPSLSAVGSASNNATAATSLQPRGPSHSSYTGGAHASSVHYADTAIDGLDEHHATAQSLFSNQAIVDTSRHGPSVATANAFGSAIAQPSSMSMSRYSTTASSSSTSNEMLLDVNAAPRYERLHQPHHFDVTGNATIGINSNTFTKSLTHHPHQQHHPHPQQTPRSPLPPAPPVRNTIRDSLESSSSSHLMHTSTTSSASAHSSQHDAADVTVKMRRKAAHNHNEMQHTASVPSSSSAHDGRKHKTLEHRYGKIMQRNENGELAFATATATNAAHPLSPFTSPTAQRRSSSNVGSHSQAVDRNDSNAVVGNGNEINQSHRIVGHRNGDRIIHHYQQPSMMCDNRQTAAATAAANYASNNNTADDELTTAASGSGPMTNTTIIHVGSAHHHNNNNSTTGAMMQQQQRQSQQQQLSGYGTPQPTTMTTFGGQRLSPVPPPRRETLKPHHHIQVQQQQQQQQQHQQHQQRLLAAESNRNNMLRTANHHRYANASGGPAGSNWMNGNAPNGAAVVNGVAAAASHHQLAHMINSLSSPESAYSTGYSTDGTSPGATTCTPEYYINMRTGTHYFPRAGIAACGDPNRVKFALNKIDEAPATATTPGHHALQQQHNVHPHVTPNGGALSLASQRRLESMSCEMARRHFPAVVRGGLHATSLVLTESATVGFAASSSGNSMGHHHVLAAMATKSLATGSVAGLSPDVQRRLTIQSYKGMESPSPRQRCRIRTNPWVSSIDPAIIVGVSKMNAIDMETSSTSSGIKSSSDAGADEKPGINIISSGSEKSSSDTEIEVSKLSKSNITPGTVRKRRIDLVKTALSESMHADSDEDATFNEMMGKFDESYCYEKETDILSDSDPTECVSDLDTGQDGGDECDTDDPLEIDYIDTASIQEVVDNAHVNTGSCSYHPIGGTTATTTPKRTQTRRSVKKQVSEDQSTTSGRRRKRLTRTRKSNSREYRDGSTGNGESAGGDSPARMQSDRGTRSVGGTPVSLRRNKHHTAKSVTEIKPMRNRANSLTFSDDHALRNNTLAVAESEKALIRADLEADVKYKQLIHEAEIILVSMKTSTSASPSVRETPVASPRRVCSIPTNKRVEMLRQCEADLRREINKAQKQNETIVDLDPPPPSAQHAQENINMLVNKRIEVLKLETISTPNSPKSARFSPRKTHVSNFIYLNTSPTDLMRRKSTPDAVQQRDDGASHSNHPGTGTAGSNRSPKLQLNGRRPPKSPTPSRRRFRSQSPRVSAINSDSDSTPEEEAALAMHGGRMAQRRSSDKQRAPTKEMNGNSRDTRLRRLSPASGRRQLKEDALNSNGPVQLVRQQVILASVKAPLLSFRSVDMGNCLPETCYCPQSEPLKRKVYSGSHTLEKLKKTLEQESEIPKQALLEKIAQLRRERKLAAAQTQAEQFLELGNQPPDSPYLERRADSTDTYQQSDENQKQLMILSTLAELKRSLEDQSVELCGLNDDEI